METENKKSGKVKKIVIGVIIMFSIICCLAGCDDSEDTMKNNSVTGSEKEVKERIEGYCEAIKGFDLDKTGKYLGSEHDYWVNMNENVLNTFMDIFEDGVSKIEYTIEDIKVDENREIFSWADVTVHFRFLDYSQVMSDSLDRLENEYDTNTIPSDLSDEEIYQRLYEIFVEEQKAAGETWNDIVISFSLLKNRNKSNPKWYLNSIPEDISTIITCNTELSFERYASISNESGMTPEECIEQVHDENDGASRKENDKRKAFGIGDTVSITNGINKIDLTLTEWGTVYDTWSNETLTYISYSVVNTGNENIYVSDSIFNVYADDYSVEKTIYMEDSQSYSANLSSGRKFNGKIYLSLNPNKADNIEVECGDVLFVLKDVETQEITDAGEGTYFDSYNSRFINKYGNFTMSDLGLDNAELDFYWEKGENEDATGADIYISYDETWQTVRVTGIWWNSVDEKDFDCAVKDILDDRTFLVTDDAGTTMTIEMLDEGGIYVEQVEDLTEMGEVFNGTYQLR